MTVRPAHRSALAEAGKSFRCRRPRGVVRSMILIPLTPTLSHKGRGSEESGTRSSMSWIPIGAWIA